MRLNCALLNLSTGGLPEIWDSGITNSGGVCRLNHGRFHGVQTALTRVDGGGNSSPRDRHDGLRGEPQSARSRQYHSALQKEYGQLGTAKIREMNELRHENTSLQRLIVDLRLEKSYASGCAQKR